MTLTTHVVAGALAVTAYAIVVVPVSRLRRFIRRRRGGRPWILWAPIPVINIRYSALADRLYGYRSETLVYKPYSINREHDFDHVLTRLVRLPLVGLLAPYGVFLWAGFRYDIFGVFFDGGLLGSTPWWSVELRLLRLAGKSIVVYPYGGDARLASKTRELGGGMPTRTSR